MSQTAAPQAAPPPPAPQPAATPAPAARPEPADVDTPTLLNRLQLAGMAVVIVFAILSALIQFLSWQADGRAADDTEQLVRVQEIQSSLLRADALATNAFLVGGLEDPEQRSEYDAALESVLTMIADAADAQPADREALAALNVDVADYATAVAQARDNNRLGFPVGAQYLREASDDLRTQTLPILDNLVKANTDRAEGAMAAQHPFWLIILGIVVLVAVVWLNRELAKRFRRRINKGVAIAAIIVLAVTLVSVLGAAVRDNSNDDLRDGEFATAVSEAKVRTAANDAKANESLRLINRGSGEGYESKWEESAEVVDELATEQTKDLWADYVRDHEEIVKLDRDGEWDEAVAKATNNDASTLDPVDEAAAETVTKNAGIAQGDLRSGRTLALLFSGLTLLLGVAAAIAIARGIGERRREFS